MGLTCGLLLLLVVVAPYWIPSVARSLACEEQLRPSEAILVENVEANYLVFERAGDLQRAGMGSKVLVTTTAGRDPDKPHLVAAGFVDVLARAARLPEPPRLIPIQEIEPISLNAAYQVRSFLQKAHVRSVILVTPGFRSRRSQLVYGSVLGDAGIATSCVPVFGLSTPENWTGTWHGIQEVVVQFVKLQYYRLYVLPWLKRDAE